MLLMAEETKTPRDEKLTQNFLIDKWRENKIWTQAICPHSGLLNTRKYSFPPTKSLSLSLNFLLYKSGVSSKEPTCQCRLDIRDTGSIPGSGRSPEAGHSNPLQYSCLENPMDRGAWRAAVHGVPKSQTDQMWSLLFSMVAKTRNNVHQVPNHNMLCQNFYPKPINWSINQLQRKNSPLEIASKVLSPSTSMCVCLCVCKYECICLGKTIHSFSPECWE